MQHAIEPLYSDKVPVIIREKHGLEKHSEVNVELTTNTNGSSLRQLNVQLTMDSDPFFLFILELKESDFFVIKNDQRLLVDFQSFPSKFIDLLKSCVTSENRSNKLLATVVYTENDKKLHSGGALSQQISQKQDQEKLNGDAIFNIVETNQFKEMTHLALKLQRGDLNSVAKHLYTGLNNTRENLRRITLQLEKANCENTKLEQKLGDLQIEIKTNNMKSLTEKTLTEEKYANEITSIKQKHEVEIQNCLSAADSSAKRLQSELESSRQESEQRYQELVQKRKELSSLEDVKKDLEQRLNEMSKQNSIFDNENTRLRALEVEYNKRDTKSIEQASSVAILKEQLSAKTEMYEQSSNRVKTLEETVKDMQNRLNISVEEIKNGNDLISRYREQLSSTKKKLRSACSVDSNAEQSMKDRLVEAETKEKMLEDEVSYLKGKLTEGQELLRSNQEVIEYLNKQRSVNEVEKERENETRNQDKNSGTSLIESLSSRLVSQQSNQRRATSPRTTSPLPRFPSLLENDANQKPQRSYNDVGHPVSSRPKFPLFAASENFPRPYSASDIDYPKPPKRTQVSPALTTGRSGPSGERDLSRPKSRGKAFN